MNKQLASLLSWVPCAAYAHSTSKPFNYFYNEVTKVAGGHNGVYASITRFFFFDILFQRRAGKKLHLHNVMQTTVDTLQLKLTFGGSTTTCTHAHNKHSQSKAIWTQRQHHAMLSHHYNLSVSFLVHLSHITINTNNSWCLLQLFNNLTLSGSLNWIASCDISINYEYNHRLISFSFCRCIIFICYFRWFNNHSCSRTC